MSSPEGDFWRWLAEHLWVPFIGALGLVWSLLTGRIKRLEDSVEEHTITRSEFASHAKADESALSNLRADLEQTKEDVGQLFSLVREAERNNSARHVELLNAIHAVALEQRRQKGQY